MIIGVSNVALAQQDPLYSQYINNPYTLNPAYAGFTNNLNASVSYRKQWTGFEGNPTTFNANGHISLSKNTMGAGLIVVSDRTGATTINEVYGSYAYRIKIASAKTLSFGLQAGVINYKTDNSNILIQHTGDPLFAAEINEVKPGLGAGAMFTSDKLFIGISVPRLLKAKIDFQNTKETLYTQHFYAMGSYQFFVNEHIRLKPAVLMKMVKGAPVSVDVNAAFIFHENYLAGILTRNLSTYGIFLQGIIKDSFRVGYAFEMPTNKSVGSKFTTHEVTVGLRVNVLAFHVNNISGF
jgi:type IX secretion system PorP/SprF family membrane protein